MKRKTRSDDKYTIKSFLKSELQRMGLRYGYDFSVKDNSLFIRHLKDKTGRILITLKEVFPVFNFYWETPRILVWF